MNGAMRAVNWCCLASDWGVLSKNEAEAEVENGNGNGNGIEIEMFPSPLASSNEIDAVAHAETKRNETK